LPEGEKGKKKAQGNTDHVCTDNAQKREKREFSYLALFQRLKTRASGKQKALSTATMNPPSERHRKEGEKGCHWDCADQGRRRFIGGSKVKRKKKKRVYPRCSGGQSQGKKKKKKITV